MQRSYFSGEIKPTPVITTRGLCFALNTRHMKEVYRSSEYVDNFENVFQNNISHNVLKGHHRTIELDIDMQSKYLKDRASMSGNFWYV